MTVSSVLDRIREQAWQEAFFAHGTAYIFEQRANRYRWLLRVLAFLGLVGPLTIGAIYLSFNSQQALLSVFFLIAGIVGIVQLLFSVWSLVARWEESYSYALEALAANYRLSFQFAQLAQYPPEKAQDSEIQFNLLQTENSLRSAEDNKQGITDKERRKGMRAALRKFRRECAGCNQIPVSMKPNNCDVCGNF